MSRRPPGRGNGTWTAVVVVGAALLITADHCGWLLARTPDDVAAFNGVEVRVGRVIDGDTIEVDARDPLHDRRATQVRLWGVDCPELAGPYRVRGQPYADEARSLARTLVDGQRVRLLLESHRTRGVHGRLLAHVELADGSSLNEALLAAGLARADDRWPHAMLERYARIERSCRREGVGLWSRLPDDQ